MIFFLAGFETTAHSMGSLCYHLAKNPEVGFRKINAGVSATSVIPRE